MFWGIVLILVGLVLMMDRLDWPVGLLLSARYWPFILIALGILRLMDPPVARGTGHRSRRPGAWLIFIGCWGLVNEFRVFGLGYATSWPILVVGAGLSVVWRALEPGPTDTERSASHGH